MGVRRWSLARQLLLLQVVLLVLVIGAGLAAVVVQTRAEVTGSARVRVTTLANSLAASPYVLEQVRGARPATTLQPYARSVCEATGVDFVVFMAVDRTRYSHPNPALVGQRYVGTVAPAVAGGSVTETYTGSLGPSVRTVAPIRDGDGTVVALVSVGITTQAIGEDIARQLPAVALVGGLALAVALGGALLVSRRLRRQTHGLGPAEITRMYEYYEAVLHSVREGLVLVDPQGVVQLANDEARRLLGLPADPVGSRAHDLPLPESLRATLDGGQSVLDQLHLAGDRVLVVSQLPARWDGHLKGAVVILRDRTELISLTGELDTARALADSLRAQAHESANRMHTLVSLIELGQPEQAVQWATEELRQSQDLVDRVVGALDEPVLAALLLGKSALAAQRGVDLALAEGSRLGTPSVPVRDLVTVIGNLVDNAIDAAAEGDPPRRVDVLVRPDGDRLLVRVADSGRGLDEEGMRRAFERGWTTKPSADAHGRGIGLTLVEQVVHRHGGRIDVGHHSDAVLMGHQGGAVSMGHQGGAVLMGHQGGAVLMGHHSGAVFTVHLPAGPASVAVGAPPAAGVTRGSP